MLNTLTKCNIFWQYVAWITMKAFWYIYIYIYTPTKHRHVSVLACVCLCVTQSVLWWRGGLTLAGVSRAVSESDQRCLSWEELGTHSQNVCMGQTDRATSVGVCSSHMCSQACEHMPTNTHTRTHAQACMQRYVQREKGFGSVHKNLNHKNWEKVLWAAHWSFFFFQNQTFTSYLKMIV